MLGCISEKGDKNHCSSEVHSLEKEAEKLDIKTSSIA
jgi:hypothetical protein